MKWYSGSKFLASLGCFLMLVACGGGSGSDGASGLNSGADSGLNSGSGSGSGSGAGAGPDANSGVPSFGGVPGEEAPEPPRSGEFANFESGQVRPLALSEDGNRLFAVNTPDNRLEIFDVSGSDPVLIDSVKVGLEPVAVAVHPNGQAWVVNHLSDSVSVVDTVEQPARVIKTLLVGDEPRDIVFAGSNQQRAFISAAHRGQNTGFDPQWRTEGAGRADVWVFDVDNPGAAYGGSPVTVVNMLGDTLRALATSADGSQVYAAVFNSGNRTTVLAADIASGGLTKPPPRASADSQPQPATGLIVKFDGSHWRDNGDPTRGVAGAVWDDRVRFSLPDNDLFVINADAGVPSARVDARGVGTTLFNIAVNPVNGVRYVSNTEARNHVRFEGPGTRSTTLRGHFVESRITAVGGGQVRARHLNKHIASYDNNLGTVAERRKSLAMPLGMVVSGDGQTLYVAAYGSRKIGIFDTGELESGAFQPDDADHIDVGGGPSGMVLDEARGRLFVLTRFDNSIKQVDVAGRRVVGDTALFNPEPEFVVQGRPFLYDARESSSRGDSSCSGCHVFGDIDHLAWDLGNPDETVQLSPNQYVEQIPADQRLPLFHPMKGPMTTQTFRGMRDQGPMHWRGDRTGVVRSANESIEEQAFEDFNVAYVGLVGRSEPLSERDMDAFAKFALSLRQPPNPIRALDNSLTATQVRGRDFYMNTPSVTGDVATCHDCHSNDPGNQRFGTSGLQSAEGDDVAEDFKVPHLRSLYQKVGRFGSTGNPGDGRGSLGPQVRGFGFAHDGAFSTLEDFLESPVFKFDNQRQRKDVVEFIMAFPAEFAPIVGQQVTVSAQSIASAQAQERLALLMNGAGNQQSCELIVSGVLGGAHYSGVFNGEGTFSPATTREGAQTIEQLLRAAIEPGNALTFTCVPEGNGRRLGVDRNLDGVLDGD